MALPDLMSRVAAGERVSGGEWLVLAREASLQELGFLAHAIRMRLHPEPLVTYVIDRNINYTDICISGCKFCAFFQAPGDRGTVLSREALAQKIRETRALGGTQVLL